MGSNAFEGAHFNRRRDFDITYSNRPSGTLYINTDLTLTLSCVYLGETLNTATTAFLDSLGLSNVYTDIFNDDGEVKTNLRPIPIDWNLNSSNYENALESRAKLPLKTLRDISRNMGVSPQRYGAAVATSLMHTLVVQGGEV
jgi:hypothetical protein